MALQSTYGPELSLIVTTYNESENIISLVERVHESLAQYSYELIVVDDNSPDGTAELAQGLVASYPLRVIVRTNEQGMASAVVAGFNQAGGAMLGVIDADLRYPPEMIPVLVEEIRHGADVAIASRYVEGGGMEGGSVTREFISRVARLPVSLLLPSTRGIRDPLAGLFLFKRDVIDGVALAPTGYKILLEVLVKGKPRQVVEIPYTFKEKGESRRAFKDGINSLIHLSRLAWAEGEVKRFLKFCTVGASGTVVYLGLLSLLTEVGGLYYILSAALGYEVSILTNFTLNELWTFRDRRSSGQRWSVLTRAVKFNIVSLGGLAIHEAVLFFFTEFVGLFYIASAIFGIATAVLWNFFVNVGWTWRQEKEIGL
ncbi:MAG: glycosyltransferase family 2 protein [Chloroflexota bacterium]|nr:glycosyltransferase family 2 protein [Chloroflexota bacterium]